MYTLSPERTVSFCALGWWWQSSFSHFLPQLGDVCKQIATERRLITTETSSSTGSGVYDERCAATEPTAVKLNLILLPGTVEFMNVGRSALC